MIVPSQTRQIPHKVCNNAHNCQQGFSLIEALMAIALIAFAMVPLLILQGQMTKTTIALQNAEEIALTTDAAIGFIKTINPTVQPTGRQMIGSAEMSWSAVPVSNPKPARTSGGSAGRFEVQLFNINIEITHSSSIKSQITTRRIGMRATEPFLPSPK